MKFKVMSDLHLESSPFNYTTQKDDKDTVLFLLGDIGITSRGQCLITFLQEMSCYFKDVIYVYGNHEFYHTEIYSEMEYIEAELKSWDNVHILTNKSIIIDGIRILGTPLYTNFNNNPAAIQEANRGINDFIVTKINVDGKTRYLHPNDLAYMFDQSVRWLKYKLEDFYDGKTMVVTHWSPTHKLTDERFNGDSLNSYFCNDMEYLMHYYKIDTWLYGHVHSRHVIDYDNERFNGTRIICNCKGYSNELVEFNPNLIWEI